MTPQSTQNWVISSNIDTENAWKFMEIPMISLAHDLHMIYMRGGYSNVSTFWFPRPRSPTVVLRCLSEEGLHVLKGPSHSDPVLCEKNCSTLADAWAAWVWGGTKCGGMWTSTSAVNSEVKCMFFLTDVVEVVWINQKPQTFFSNVFFKHFKHESTWINQHIASS